MADVPDVPAYRLPRVVSPSRYEITLTPDLDAATFAGEERVEIRVHEPVDASPRPSVVPLPPSPLQQHDVRI